MRRALVTSLTVFTLSALLAPAAFASEPGGQGWWGETTDKDITSAAFLVIIFFPLLILVLSKIQTRLEKRKYARLEADKARRARADLRGGW